MKKESICEKCIHRREFKTNDGDPEVTLFLCLSEPYDDEPELGILTWFDVLEWGSERCMNFKAKEKK